ncbi:helix-turn-helix transcriptional regulator [Maridesulfovibrio sp.]|uniref:helix-turn-helix domain-containing protein n=1 Tax=Maridesulfovibrio sp. TaxID=2795000 RepID=UPI002A18E230|nr:helix-turn-helix transcriptional regulator [Maridesulfovibrio sp.]
MLLNFSKEWCIRKAREEYGYNINAGSDLSLRHTNCEYNSCSTTQYDGARVAFGKLIFQLRQKNNLSYEDLARKANIDLKELKNIEINACCIPTPRTVYTLANFFNLNITKLLQLAGLTEKREKRIEEKALAFAASSEPLKKLSSEEIEILETFVAVLSEKE